jgi:hypothetical protein
VSTGTGTTDSMLQGAANKLPNASEKLNEAYRFAANNLQSFGGGSSVTGDGVTPGNAVTRAWAHGMTQASHSANALTSAAAHGRVQIVESQSPVAFSKRSRGRRLSWHGFVLGGRDDTQDFSAIEEWRLKGEQSRTRVGGGGGGGDLEEGVEGPPEGEEEGVSHNTGVVEEEKEGAESGRAGERESEGERGTKDK